MLDYKIYKSDTIINNHERFVEICEYAKQWLMDEFQGIPNTTWMYKQYNIFSYTSSSILFYDLYKDLNNAIRDYIGDDRRVWFQSWMNFLSYDEIEEVLHTHGHDFDIHGYISVDPKNTITEFTNFEVKNEIGNIYIGPCGEEYRHRVKNVDKWDGSRITIGFDCTFDADRVHAANNKLFPIL